jgi:hypothetical protein
MNVRPRRTLQLIICAAPPAEQITELVEVLQGDAWNVYPIATPTAYTWLPVEDVEQMAGHPVLYRPRLPGVPSTLPAADAIVVAPATFNTINQWAVGINDTLALGILNEALGSSIPIIASVYAKPALMSHPAITAHLSLLVGAGVRFTAPEALRPAEPHMPFHWETIAGLLRHATDDQTR